MRNSIPVFVVVLALAYGCGSGEGGDSAAEAPVDLNGTSLGVVVITGGTAYPPESGFAIVFDLVQSGTAVSGDYNISAGENPTSGTLAGTLTGRTFTFTLTQDDPCNGSFSGSATVASSGTSFSGPFSGLDCSGTTEAWFSASK